MSERTQSNGKTSKKYSVLFATTLIVYMMLTIGMLTCFFLSVFLFGICKSVITGIAFIICMASFSYTIIKMLSNEKKSYDPDSCDFFVNRKETDEQKSSLPE